MADRHKAKEKRQAELTACLEDNPFLTDEELAKLFGVSVSTIRLDRLELGIPELRERIRLMAERQFPPIRSLSGGELVGELITLEMGRQAISLMEITDQMVLAKTRIARGHHLFAQANSLAVAVIDAEVVLTGYARIRFKRPVYIHDKVVAKAEVVNRKHRVYHVEVTSRVGLQEVFRGKFILFTKEV